MKKKHFNIADYLQYGLPRKRFPIHCGCSNVYTVQHALSCKKGEFVTLRHNKLRNIIDEMLEEVRNDVKLELILPLRGHTCIT